MLIKKLVLKHSYKLGFNLHCKFKVFNYNLQSSILFICFKGTQSNISRETLIQFLCLVLKIFSSRRYHICTITELEASRYDIMTSH